MSSAAHHSAVLVPADTSREPLLADVEHDADTEGRAKVPEEHQAAISILQLFVTPELRKPLIIVCFSMLCQQLSGVNAGMRCSLRGCAQLLTRYKFCTTVTTSCRRRCQILAPLSL